MKEFHELFEFHLWKQVLKQGRYMYLFSTNFALDFVDIPRRDHRGSMIEFDRLLFALHQCIDYKEQ